ncbi:helix-turn-helix domain-containing protein [Dactylosporangium sp. NPDC000521]|uniref:helix-turn-helix domain-containing protein n=1 Tax=Dactylosporangium sp. NPDC000521 TaxID=3363975 RepID=UPI0036A548CA
MDEEPRTRLARMIRERRVELRLSERQAALRAGIARNTWASAEEGARQPAERSIASIEAALAWLPGSIERILAGGEPASAGQPAEPQPGLPPKFDIQAEIDRASRLDLPAEARIEIIRRLMDLYEESQANRR